MKIAILTSGILPVPAVQGGAVENLTDFYLEYNHAHSLHDVTVYSVWHPDVDSHPALKSQTNHYVYIKVDGWQAKLKKRLRRLTHGEGYYHYSIEYYLDEALKDIRRKHFDVIVVENRPGYALRLKGITQARLAAAITDLYEHPEKRKKMSEASLSRSRAFGKDAYARNFFAMLPTAIT